MVVALPRPEPVLRTPEELIEFSYQALRDSLQRCRQAKPVIKKPLNNGHQE